MPVTQWDISAQSPTCSGTSRLKVRRHETDPASLALAADPASVPSRRARLARRRSNRASRPSCLTSARARRRFSRSCNVELRLVIGPSTPPPACAARTRRCCARTRPGAGRRTAPVADRSPWAHQHPRLARVPDREGALLVGGRRFARLGAAVNLLELLQLDAGHPFNPRIFRDEPIVRARPRRKLVERAPRRAGARTPRSQRRPRPGVAVGLDRSEPFLDLGQARIGAEALIEIGHGGQGSDCGPQILPVEFPPNRRPVCVAHLASDRSQIAQSDFLALVERDRPHVTRLVLAVKLGKRIAPIAVGINQYLSHGHVTAGMAGGTRDPKPPSVSVVA
jgi:hypothetical protein